MKQQESGYTLVELAISAAITVLMVLAVMGMFRVGQDACMMGSANLTVQLTNSTAFAEMTRTIRQSRIHSVSGAAIGGDPVIGPPGCRINGGNGGWIKVQVPVRLTPSHIDLPIEADDDVLDASANLVWGATNGRKNWAVIYTFVPTGTFDEDLSPIPSRRLDLNRDGDADDAFSTGYIGEWIVDDPDSPSIYIPSGHPRPITPACVVMQMFDTGPGNNPSQGPGADVDNLDGEDPLFLLVNDKGETYSYNPLDPDTHDQADDSRRVRISFFAFKLADSERTILARPTTIVGPRCF